LPEPCTGAAAALRAGATIGTSLDGAACSVVGADGTTGTSPMGLSVVGADTGATSSPGIVVPAACTR